VSWNERRYSPWLLDHEQALMARQERTRKVLLLFAAIIALMESLTPWDQYTPDIPAWLHIAVTALAMPLLYFMHQNDFRAKQQAFTLAMADRGRRLLFLDPYMEPEEFALAEQMQGAHLLPLRRQMDNLLKSSGGVSLHRRVEYYYRTLPSATHEGDRMGVLSALHPGTFAYWMLGLALTVLLAPGLGINLGSSDGLTWLPLLFLLFLYGKRVNSRLAFEDSLFSWLRLG
jgi:hypothetical protein